MIEMIDYDTIKNIAGDKFAQQFFTWTTSLSLASFIHSGRVKKELGQMTQAINKFAEALHERIGKVEARLDKIENMDPK